MSRHDEARRLIGLLWFLSAEDALLQGLTAGQSIHQFRVACKARALTARAPPLVTDLTFCYDLDLETCQNMSMSRWVGRLHFLEDSNEIP